MKELLQLIRNLESKSKDVQFEIDWMVKKNEETPLVYQRWEIQREMGKQAGLLMAIKIAREGIIHIQQAEQLSESMNKMSELLDKMNEIIDNEKQLKLNTPTATV